MISYCTANCRCIIAKPSPFDRSFSHIALLTRVYWLIKSGQTCINNTSICAQVPACPKCSSLSHIQAKHSRCLMIFMRYDPNNSLHSSQCSLQPNNTKVALSHCKNMDGRHNNFSVLRAHPEGAENVHFNWVFLYSLITTILTYCSVSTLVTISVSLQTDGKSFRIPTAQCQLCIFFLKPSHHQTSWNNIKPTSSHL